MIRERQDKEIKHTEVFGPKVIANSFYSSLRAAGYEPYRLDFDVVIDERIDGTTKTTVTKIVDFDPQQDLGDCREGIILLEAPDPELLSYLLSFDSHSDDGWTDHILGISVVPNHTRGDIQQWRRQLSEARIHAFQDYHNQPDNSLEMRFRANGDVSLHLNGGNEAIINFFNSIQRF